MERVAARNGYSGREHAPSQHDTRKSTERRGNGRRSAIIFPEAVVVLSACTN